MAVEAETPVPPNPGTDLADAQTDSDAISKAIATRMRARYAAVIVPLFILVAVLFLAVATTGI